MATRDSKPRAAYSGASQLLLHEQPAHCETSQPHLQLLGDPGLPSAACGQLLRVEACVAAFSVVLCRVQAMSGLLGSCEKMSERGAP